MIEPAGMEHPPGHGDDEAFIGGEGGLPEGVEVLDDLEGELRVNGDL